MRRARLFGVATALALLSPPALAQAPADAGAPGTRERARGLPEGALPGEPSRSAEGGRPAPGEVSRSSEGGRPAPGEPSGSAGAGLPPAPRPRAPRLVLTEPERLPPITEARLRAHLEVRAAAVRAGDGPGAELALGLLEEARDALGAPNAILAAVVLVEEAQAARAAGDVERALEVTGRALRLAPDLLAAHWLRVNLLVERDATRVARIAHTVGSMLDAWTRSFRNRVHLLTLLAAAALLGTTAGVVLLALVLLARHLRFLAHDLSSGLPRVVGGGEMTLLLLLGVLLPGALGLGWPATVGLALGLTLAYQTSRERLLAVAGIALVSASPWVAGLAAPLIAFHGSRVDHLSRVLEEAFAQPAEAALVAHAGRHPDDALTSTVLGVRAARRSDLETAERRLGRAVEAEPRSVAALNDLGVVEYRRGAHDAAERHLREAARIDGHAAPHLNLSLIASDRGDFETAQVHGSRARELDSELVESVSGRAGLPTESRLTLIDVSPARLWAELYDLDASEVGATRAQIWRKVGGRVQPWTIPAWGLLALALGLLGFRVRDPSGPCVRCGAPAPSSVPTGQCSQCQSVFGGSSAVAPGARARKEREVRGYRLRHKWAERFLAVVPGLGDLFAGRTLSGYLFLWSFSCLAALAWLRGALALHAWHVPGDGSGGRIVLLGALGLALVLSLLSLRRAFVR